MKRIIPSEEAGPDLDADHEVSAMQFRTLALLGRLEGVLVQVKWEHMSTVGLPVALAGAAAGTGCRYTYG